MNRDLRLIALSLFTWGLGESSFLAFQPLYLQELGASPVNIGAALSGFGLAATVAHIPAGYLADRIGRKPVMVAAWLLGILSTGIMALATRLPGFVAGMLLYGLTLFVLAPLYSYVTAARGGWSVGRAITTISASYNLGAIIGPTLGGAMGDHFGFRSIFMVAPGIFILSTLLLLMIHPQPVEAFSARGTRGNIFSNTPYLQFVLVYFLVIFAMFLPQPLAPNFLQNQRGLNLATIGQLYSVGALGIVVLNLVLGRLKARLGFIIGQACAGLFALLLWLGNGLPVYALAFFLLGGFRAARGLATAQVRALVPAASMGLAYGLAETASSTATILAPLLAGYVYQLEPERIFTFSVAFIAVAILASWLSTLNRPADQEEIQTVPAKDLIH